MGKPIFYAAHFLIIACIFISLYFIYLQAYPSFLFNVYSSCWNLCLERKDEEWRAFFLNDVLVLIWLNLDCAFPVDHIQYFYKKNSYYKQNSEQNALYRRWTATYMCLLCNGFLLMFLSIVLCVLLYPPT